MTSALTQPGVASGCLLGLHVWLRLRRCPDGDCRAMKMGSEADYPVSRCFFCCVTAALSNRASFYLRNSQLVSLLLLLNAIPLRLGSLGQSSSGASLALMRRCPAFPSIFNQSVFLEIQVRCIPIDHLGAVLAYRMVALIFLLLAN